MTVPLIIFKTRKLFPVLSAIMCLPLYAGAPANYPVPPGSMERLFYLQRSNNSNTVIYDANLKEDGGLDERKPVVVYWLRYNTTGERKALNFVERNFAYGYKAERLKEGTHSITLMAYTARDITVVLDDSGRAEARIEINRKKAKLDHIYIDTSGSGLLSRVNYIELMGADLKTGKPVSERFNPNDDNEF